MNKELTIEYLYDVFSYASKKQKDFSYLFNDLLKNNDFLQMIENKPFDITRILMVIDTAKGSDVVWNINKIRYLSFLISEFIDRTNVNKKLLDRYIYPDDVFVNFNYYHSQDINNVIFYLFIKHNERFKLRKLSDKTFLDAKDLSKPFIKLFPFKRFDFLKLIFDKKISKQLFCLEEEILLYSDEINELLEDDYFVQRYCVGNKIYCFTNKQPKYINKYTIYYFIIKEDGLSLITPSGITHKFWFSE